MQTAAADEEYPTISAFLQGRLKQLGVDHIFGIPGDFILPFYQILMDSEIEHVAACNELDCGYAADGYAREKGLAAIAVTYGAGSFCTVNAIAGAYAENVPLVLISGGPPVDTYSTQPTTHHTLPKKYDASIKIFSEITAHAKLISDASSAAALIDEALEICLTESKPVYLEIPMDLQTQSCTSPENALTVPEKNQKTSDRASLDKVISLLKDRLRAGGSSAILLGQEIRRSGLEDTVTQLIEHTNLPVITMFDEKASYIEHLDQCIGIYQGACSDTEMNTFVESADTLLFLGVVDSDFNFGGSLNKLDPKNCVWVFDGKVKTEGRIYDEISITDLVHGLLESLPANCGSMDAVPRQKFYYRSSDAYQPQAEAKISSNRLLHRLAHFIKSNDILVADGPAAVNAVQIQLPEGCKYMASSYWAAIGHGFAASLGTCLAAEEDRRVLVLVGDGSFQICGQELSSMIRYGVTPIIILMNNEGYTAERLIHDGAFNDVAHWKYHKLSEVFDGVIGSEVFTEGELEVALERAEKHKGPGPLLIEIHLDPYDVSFAFKMLSEKLR